MKIHSIIIDDEPGNIENLSIQLNKYFPRIEVAHTFTKPEDALHHLKGSTPDLIFLDIEMHGLTGFDLLAKLDTIDFEVVFVTAFDRYAMQAFKFAAIDYILKPVDIEDLILCINRIETRLAEKTENRRLQSFVQQYQQTTSSPTRRIPIPGAEEIRFIEVDTIVRVEGEVNYSCFYLDDGSKLMSSKTLKVYQDMLSEYGFMRVHQSHLANVNHILSFQKTDGGYLLMSDQSKIRVARARKEQVLNALMQSK